MQCIVIGQKSVLMGNGYNGDRLGSSTDFRYRLFISATVQTMCRKMSKNFRKRNASIILIKGICKEKVCALIGHKIYFSIQHVIT